MLHPYLVVFQHVLRGLYFLRDFHSPSLAHGCHLSRGVRWPIGRDIALALSMAEEVEVHTAIATKEVVGPPALPPLRRLLQILRMNIIPIIGEVEVVSGVAEGDRTIVMTRITAREATDRQALHLALLIRRFPSHQYLPETCVVSNLVQLDRCCRLS